MLKYKEMCLYCKSFNRKTEDCSAKKYKVNPRDVPEEIKCNRYKMSDDAKFAFGDDAISYYEKNPWSEYKRKALLKEYENVLKVRM